MEIGPTTHYIMGGVRVDADSQMSTIPGLFAAGECASGINGANRLGGNSLSDLIVFGKRAGEYAAEFARKQGARQSRRRRGRAGDQGHRWRRSSGAPAARTRTRCRKSCRRRCRAWSASSGRKTRCSEALARLQSYKERAARVGVSGHREYNGGWHTALDLHNLLTVAGSDHALGDRAQGKPRRPLPRRLPGQDRRSSARSTSWSSAAPAVASRSHASRSREMPPELKQVIEEQKQ